MIDLNKISYYHFQLKYPELNIFLYRYITLIIEKQLGYTSREIITTYVREYFDKADMNLLKEIIIDKNKTKIMFNIRSSSRLLKIACNYALNKVIEI